ncbi:lytic polysaccharide monooxygenase [Pseudomonas syringae]|uniref:lytic polysaccharide monooxygenase auxiliary activity family 9 protein n=1 Tax=Pseudomonas syringae TaxID=317 RepID=UPI0019170441|nr:lytic polysaccharide monooxygenase auxiliary activity family 9 protein [Pseudomonas syringae]QQQ53086.1 lytic polysaccharide monooxygenase [Pseudomonas syringae]
MPDLIIEDRDMSESADAQPKHGMVIKPESRGSYAISQGLLLEWEVVAMEGGKNFPDPTFGLAHDFPGFDEPINLDPLPSAPPLADPPQDGLILCGGQGDRRKCLNYTDSEIVEEIKILKPTTKSTGWPRKLVNGGEEFTVTWNYPAKHVTRGYRWFITKEGWDDSKRITRESFKEKNHFSDKHFTADGQDGLMWSDISDLSPFDQHRDELQPKVITTARLPKGKRGHHVILLVWIVAETDKAFYQAFDVDFVA